MQLSICMQWFEPLRDCLHLIFLRILELPRFILFMLNAQYNVVLITILNIWSIFFIVLIFELFILLENVCSRILLYIYTFTYFVSKIFGTVDKPLLLLYFYFYIVGVRGIKIVPKKIVPHRNPLRCVIYSWFMNNTKCQQQTTYDTGLRLKASYVASLLTHVWQWCWTRLREHVFGNGYKSAIFIYKYIYFKIFLYQWIVVVCQLSFTKSY